MIGDLSDTDIDALLQRQPFGHLGFTDGKDVFVLPFFYTYNNGTLLMHSYEGEKLRALREHSQVAFQVEDIADPHNWSSVLVHGQFAEVSTEDAIPLIETIVRPMEENPQRQQYSPLFLQGGSHSFRNDGTPPVFFRIRIERKSGRFERQ